MKVICPCCQREFEVQVQQFRAARSRWETTDAATRTAAGKARIEKRWGRKVTLDFGRGQAPVAGYLKQIEGDRAISYRLQGDKDWKVAPAGALVGGVFYVYGLERAS